MAVWDGILVNNKLSPALLIRSFPPYNETDFFLERFLIFIKGFLDMIFTNLLNSIESCFQAWLSFGTVFNFKYFIGWSLLHSMEL